MYGPGQTHRDGPLSPGTRKAWNVVIAGLVIGGLTFLDFHGPAASDRWIQA
jgi:hypothetical protein